MFDKLKEIFQSMDVAYYRQGSLTDRSQTPSTFLTYWNLNTPYDDYGDNVKHSKVYRYYVYCYSTRTDSMYATLDEFISLAESNGLIVETDGQDIPCDYKNYAGRMTIIKYKENI